MGDALSAADIMVSFTLMVARVLGVLEPERYPELVRYLARLEQRPAVQRAAEA